jgi:hypothetical protein
LRRSIVVCAVAFVLSILIAAPALATECFNASKKNQAAGAQIVLGPGDEILYTTPGLEKRIERALVDPDSGEGFHGILGFDFDGDGVVDFSTWFGVGPDGEEIPLQAQLRGPACRGLTNIGIYFEQCLGA